MANQDLVGLLTGTPTQPIQVSSDPWQRLAQRSKEGVKTGASGGRAVGKLFAKLTGREVPDNPMEQLEKLLPNMNPENPDDLTQLAKLQMASGNQIGAARTIAQRNAILQAQELSLEKQKGITQLNQQRTQFAEYLDRTYPNKGYGALALQGLITPANMKNFIKEADKTNLTDDQKEYAQAKSQGFEGTLLEFMDRNVKIGVKNLTNEQKHLAQINEENKDKGIPQMSLSSFLEKKSTKTANLPDKIQIYNEAVRNNEWKPNDYIGFMQALAKATRAPSADDKRETLVDKNGFKRYVDNRKLVFPEVAEGIRKDAEIEKVKQIERKESTLEFLRRAGMTVIADNLENNLIGVDQAMEAANVDPRITTLANKHLQESLDLGSQSNEAINLLFTYNDSTLGVGQPAEVKRKVAAAFGVGDKNRLVTFQYAEGRIKESNILLPPGTATEMEVKRSDATQPQITESPEVIRGYLYGKAKKNALGAAQQNALQKWMINYQGNTAGFVDYWMGVINDPAKLQAIFDKAGIPPNQNFKRKVISGSNI